MNFFFGLRIDFEYIKINLLIYDGTTYYLIINYIFKNEKIFNLSNKFTYSISSKIFKNKIFITIDNKWINKVIN